METRETDTSRAMTGTPVVHDNYTLRPVGVWDLTWIALGAAALVGAQQTPTNGQAYCTNSTFTWVNTLLPFLLAPALTSCRQITRWAKTLVPSLSFYLIRVDKVWCLF